MGQTESDLVIGHGRGVLAGARRPAPAARQVVTLRLETAWLRSEMPHLIAEYLSDLRDNPPQAVLDAIADCPHGVEVTGDYESVCIRPLLLWQAALDALVSGG